MRPIKISHQIKRLSVLLTLLVLFYSCVHDIEVSTPSVHSKQVSFIAKTPGVTLLRTRAIAENSTENSEISTIDVLLFTKANKKYVGTYASGQIENLSATEKKFNVSIPTGEYDIMIVANARSIINSVTNPATEPQLKTKTAIQQLLINTLSDKSSDPMTGIWNADKVTAGFTPFPMWSEKLNVSVPSSGGAVLDITMVRMLSKVNLSFSSVAVSEKLLIESIMVCNFNKSGYLASPQWNFTQNENDAQSQEVVNERASRALGVSNGVVYANFAPYTDVIQRPAGGIQACKDEIFLFETQKSAANPSTTERIEALCLIVKGKYAGSETDSYYRIDFANRNGNAVNYLNLLRNHVYSVVINDVNGAGHPTPEIAYNSFPIDLNVGIATWNDGGMGEIAFNGQYILSVTPAEIELSREASQANSFLIYTDYPKPPTVSSVEYVDEANKNWITSVGEVVRRPDLDKEGGLKKAYYVTFNCLANPNQTTRFAKINVTVENHFNLKLSVLQTAIMPLSLSVDDITGIEKQDISELTFPSGLWESDPLQPKSMRITWAPYLHSNPCSSIVTTLGKEFVFDAPLVLPSVNSELISTTGVVECLNIKAKPFTQTEVGSPNQFLEKTKLYTYSTTNGVHTKTKSVMLKQVHYNAVAKMESIYLLDGGEYSFNIISNSSWKVEFKKLNGFSGDPNGVLSNLAGTTGGYNTTSGSEVRFKLADYISKEKYVNEQITFTITSTNPDRKFDPIEVSFTAMSAIIRELSNCYLVNPNSPPILIPVKRANGLLLDSSTKSLANWYLGTQLAETGPTSVFKAHLVWTDVKGATGKGVEKSAAIHDIKPVGKGGTGYVLVIPGEALGNAVVAATRKSTVVGEETKDEIVWSWHIWVTTYNPYDATGNPNGNESPTPREPQKYWMNRNLGAKTNILGTADAYGLFYQFGRKDPFPTPNTLGGNEAKPQYNELGGSLKFDISKSPDLELTAQQSVRRPMTISYNWWGTTGEKGATTTADPWDFGGKKTIYDPCPKGYRVPRHLNKSSTEYVYGWGTGNTLSLSSGDGISTPKYISGLGILWENKGGFYPGAGFLGFGGTYYDAGWPIGYAWSATPRADTGHAYSLKFDTSNAFTPLNGSKADVGSVRCVAEE